LMMTTAGSSNSGDEFPAGVEVDEVVVGELFALVLFGGGDACSGAIDIEGRLAGGVFAVTEDGGLGWMMRMVWGGFGVEDGRDDSTSHSSLCDEWGTETLLVMRDSSVEAMAAS